MNNYLEYPALLIIIFWIFLKTQLKTFANSKLRLELREKLIAQFGPWNQLESDLNELHRLIDHTNQLVKLPEMLNERLGSNSIAYTFSGYNNVDKSNENLPN